MKDRELNTDLITLAFDNPHNLHVLLQEYDVDTIAKLVTVLDSQSNTFLHVIVKDGQYKNLLKAILKLAETHDKLCRSLNACLLKQNQKGETPLHILAYQGEKDISAFYPLMTADTFAELALLQDKDNQNTVMHILLSMSLPQICHLFLDKLDGATLNTAIQLENSFSSNLIIKAVDYLEVLKLIAEKADNSVFNRCLLKENKNKASALSLVVDKPHAIFHQVIRSATADTFRQILPKKIRDDSFFTVAMRSQTSEDLLSLINIASVDFINAELPKASGYHNYHPINNLERIMRFHTSDAIFAILNKADLKVLYKTWLADNRYLTHYITLLDINTLWLLVKKDFFQFGEFLNSEVEPHNYDRGSLSMFILTENISADKRVLLEEVNHVLQIHTLNMQDISTISLLNFIKIIIPLAPQKITDAKKWLPILLSALKKFDEAWARNALLGLIGRAYLSFEGKENEALAQKNWLKIDEPAHLSHQDNQMIGDFFRKRMQSTSDPIITRLLESKALLHLQPSSLAETKEELKLTMTEVKEESETKNERLPTKIEVLNSELKVHYEEKLQQHLNQLDVYLAKRKKETSYFGIFGYSHHDYIKRKNLSVAFRLASDYPTKKLILEKALVDQTIIKGRRHECADIFNELLTDVELLMQFEKYSLTSPIKSLSS